MTPNVRLVYKDPEDNEWKEWSGYRNFIVQVGTFTATYHDGRQEELPCDPYPVEQAHHADRVKALLAEGIWTQDELDLIGVKVAQETDAPKGKRNGTLEGFHEVKTTGVIKTVYTLEDVPESGAAPSTSEKVDALLTDYGLSRDELKALLEK